MFPTPGPYCLTIGLIGWLIAGTASGQTLEEALRRESRAELAAASERDGDAQRGAILFHQPYLGCIQCHATDREDRLGPDLATPAGTNPPLTCAQIVESILDPSVQIRAGFEAYTVELADGTQRTGLGLQEGDESIELRDASTHTTVLIPRAQIHSVTRNMVSLMPTGQVNQLASRQQFLDLVKYVHTIQTGGAARAAELRPAPSLLVQQLPTYEAIVDHRGLVADWSDTSLATAAFERGQAIYQRLCIHCHGTHDQPGSLPTSLRFATGRFKNGAQPLQMYNTLTHGFGMMAAQTWMVPQQKYDVIHYIREAYLKPHNPSQYTSIDSAYLASLSVGSTRGPEPILIEPWALMDYGPFMMSTFEVPLSMPDRDTAASLAQSPPVGLAYKGIAVRLDSGPGGLAHGQSWMLFEHDTLRWAAAWSARESGDRQRFIDWQGIQFDGAHGIHPHLVGDVHWSNPDGPGYARPATSSWQDARITGRDGRHFGPLPRDWGHYRGTYIHGDHVVVAYTVGSTQILESPAERRDGTQRQFLRHITIGARSSPLTLLVLTSSSGPMQIEAQIAREDYAFAQIDCSAASARASNPQGEPLADPTERGPRPRATADSDLVGAERWNVLCKPWPRGAAWQTAGDALRLQLPAGNEPLVLTLGIARTADPSRQPSAESLQAPAAAGHRAMSEIPVQDLNKWTRGGPRRWTTTVETRVQRGADKGPFAVDELSLPIDNPWRCQVRPTGFDFSPDGTQVAVCTWDGDVWLVSGLEQLTTTETPPESPPTANVTLTWQRIAAGLFQPLGLRWIDDAIYLTCRDQLVILRDFNGDGEADFYESFNSDHQVTEHFHEFAMGLQHDAEGNFYYAKSARHALPALVPHHGTLLRVSRDGRETSILANGFRAANGVCLNPDGSFVVTDQEGHWNPKNRINWVLPPRAGQSPRFYGNLYGYHDVTDPSDQRMEPPLCWITNAFDRSPAELLWVPANTWGPLQGQLLNLSYGYGRIFVVPHERVDGVIQGGMMALPIADFPTGTLRGRFHPRDGQLYTCGMFAWAGNATQPGGFYRVRWTGQPMHVAQELHATPRELVIRFTDRLDPATAHDASHYQIRVWDLKRSENYGSEHYNERPLQVHRATLGEDGRTVHLEVADLSTTWCMSIDFQLKLADGQAFQGTVHNTIHRLGPDRFTKTPGLGIE